MNLKSKFFSGWSCMLLLLLLCMNQTGYSQVYPYLNYSVRQGLVNSNVYAMTQDPTGYIWLGTENGLSRFDGINFKNYTLEKLGLKSFISSLTSTPDGNLIFGSGRNGIFQFNPTTEKITIINKSNISLSNQILISGDLLLSLKEYHNYDFLSLSKGTKLYLDTISQNQSDNKALSMVQLKNDSILLGRSDGIYEFVNGCQNKMRIEGLGNCPIYSLYADENSLLAGSDGCIYRIKNNLVIDTLIVISGEEQRIRNILVDNRGNLWFNIWGLKDIYMISDNNITNVSEITGLNNGAITKIIQDKSGTIWVGVLGKGIYHFNNTHLLIYPSLNNLPNSNIRKIFKTEKGGLLMGTDDGLAYLDPKGKILISKKHMPEMTQFVRAISAVSSNKYLVAITDIRLKKPLLNSYIFSPENLNIRYAHGSSLWSDSLGTFLGNWDNNILRYKVDTYDYIDKIESIFPESNNNSRINCIYRDKYSNLWVGSQKGLCIIDRTGKKFYPQGILQQEEIIIIKPLKNEKIFLVSDRGLYFFDTNEIGEKVKELEKINLQGVTCAVLTGKNEYLVGTNYGLLYIKDNKFSLMTIHDGVLSDNINDILHEIGAKIAWVATSEGLMRVDLSILRKGNTSPIIIDIVQFHQNEKSWTPLPINNFRHDKNSFSLGFHAFHYNNAAKILYQYKIDDKEWMIAPTNEIQFASVEPGEHNIILRAGLPDEQWGPIKNITIYIEPPFYRTWWFYILSTLLCTLLVFIFIKNKIKMLKLKQEEKVKIQQKLVELQQKALASNLNPHFIFNSLNAIQHFINSKSPEEANDYLAKFARLMRMHLNMAEKSAILLHEEIQRLEFYLSLEQMRFDDKMEWSIYLDPSLDPFHLEIPNMIIQPFVENAIWHGIMPSDQKGFIALNIQPTTNEGILITVTDNGVGFNHQPKVSTIEHESKGTRLIKERLLLLDSNAADVLRFDHLSPGTMVAITLSTKMYRNTALTLPVS